MTSHHVMNILWELVSHNTTSNIAHVNDTNKCGYLRGGDAGGVGGGTLLDHAQELPVGNGLVNFDVFAFSDRLLRSSTRTTSLLDLLHFLHTVRLPAR